MIIWSIKKYFRKKYEALSAMLCIKNLASVLRYFLGCRPSWKAQLLDGLLIQGQNGVMDTVKFAVTEIARMISSIPVRDRAEATVSYQIVSPD